MSERRYNVLIYNMNTIETNRINGIERFSRKHKWNLSFESVNGFGLDLAHKWSGDGVLALFEDKRTHVNELLTLQRRGIPVVDVVNFLDAIPRAKVIADNKAIGHSIRAELMQMRLSAAKKRLRETDEKLSVVAHECGFCHVSYFERIFKREFSLTPHQFRMQERESTEPDQRASQPPSQA